MKEFDRIKKKVHIVKENRSAVSNNTDKVVSNIKESQRGVSESLP